MPSKLDYLSKYIESNDTTTNKKSKKKKKKKKHSSSDYEEPAKPPVKETAVYDEDEAIQIPNGALAEDDDDDDIMAIPEEDRPTIVSEQDLGAHGDILLPKVRAQPRGNWKTIAATEAENGKNVDDNVSVDRPPSRRRRYDSSDDDDDESNQRRRPKRRYDSDDDNRSASSAPQRQKFHSSGDDQFESKPEGTQRRRRYDSDDESNETKDKTNETMHQSRRRYDSEDEKDKTSYVEQVKEEDSVGNVRRPRRRYDSSEDDEDNELKSPSPKHRRRYDSEEDGDSIGRRKRQRFGLEEDKGKQVKEEPGAKPDITKSDNRTRRRHDSDDDVHDGENSKDNGHRRQRRKRSDSSDDEDAEDTRRRMSSGHKAGLQNYRDFNSAEKEIQQRKQRDAQIMVDKYGMGETVYRDAKGRRTTKPETPKQSMEQLEQMKNLNEGKLQRLERERQAQEMAIIKNSTFARHETDHRLEDMRRNEIRSGDPMAAYARKKEPKKKKKKSKRLSDASMVEEADEKPTYKGPPPKPNRFGIRPGYRWDGVDRGNGWEDKLLAKQYMSKAKEEEMYRWRSADM